MFRVYPGNSAAPIYEFTGCNDLLTVAAVALLRRQHPRMRSAGGRMRRLMAVRLTDLEEKFRSVAIRTTFVK